MRSPAPSGTPVPAALAPRALAALVASLCATLLIAAGVLTPARGYAQRAPRALALADSDSVALGRAAIDTSAAGTAAADSAAADTSLARRYLPRIGVDRRTASLFQRRSRPLFPRLGGYWTHELEMDSTGTYVAYERVAGSDVRYPLRIAYDDFRQARLRHDLEENWRQLSTQAAQRRSRETRGGLGVNIVVPGGRESAFAGIFGEPSVDLRVNGNANINAGFDYRKSDQQVSLTGRASRTDPTFKQDLSLGITGTIGDKLQVEVAWDTNNQFDYQNQLSLVYTGYDDEIIQKIEAGNVFLNTSSTLIQGGTSLFGLKSEMRVGGLTLTTVASQQKGQSNTLDVSGGATATEVEIRSLEYQEDTHFFLGYYFRNRWEEAMADPANAIQLADGFQSIENIEVWRRTGRTTETIDTRYVNAVVDLGEPQELLTQADAFTAEVLPTNDADQYSDAQLEQLRDATSPGDFLEGQIGLGTDDWATGEFRLLERGRDYDLDAQLGYISLSQALQPGEALAVAYTIVRNGQAIKIGDFSTETGGDSGDINARRLVLKLLRPSNISQPNPEQGVNPAAWYLEMRNLYRLNAFGLNLNNDFDLQLYYEPPGRTAETNLPGVRGNREVGTTLLQQLGLDRYNQERARTPDNQFDRLLNITIDPERNVIIFPYLEPFGSRLREVIEAVGTPEAQAEAGQYVFDNLYQQKKENARRDKQRDVYVLRGEFSGGVQSFYNLNAFSGVIEGSVQVTSGGTPLAEGADYTVDYVGGSVTITNQSYLSAGRDIQISYEANQLLNIQKKTLLGLRAEYGLNPGALDDRFKVGATMFRLNQKSPVDKFRVGEEPISNLMWGVDTQVNLEPRWLTRAIDRLPFLQTREPSAIRLSGEFAQLRPGHVETLAFEQTRRSLREQGRDFEADELEGVSYLDDFEGFELTFQLASAGTWTLSSAPAELAAPHYTEGVPLDRSRTGSDADLQRTYWRSALGWYNLNRGFRDRLDGVPGSGDAAVQVYEPEDVFPSREARAGETLTTFDLYFDPRQRGPYNYTPDLPTFLDPQNSRYAWGGITQRIPDGYNDFSLKNIEFVEFVFRPFSEASGGDAGPDAKLFVELGIISEDVLPDGRRNTEDGLSTAAPITGFPASPLARLSSADVSGTVNVDPETGLTEDLGLDGLASFRGTPGFEAYGSATEFDFGPIRDFLNGLPASSADPRIQAEINKARLDPSGDDFVYFEDDGFFGNPEYYPGGARFQERFTRFFSGTEVNSFEAQQKVVAGSGRGNSRTPDDEDLNGDGVATEKNSYYQYEVPLSLTALAQQSAPGTTSDYVVGETAEGSGWYQVRIPVREFTDKFGDIQDFTNIQSIRIWTTGHTAPVTIRFVTLDLVGSQWQTSELDPQGLDAAPDTSKLLIASINNEENTTVYAPPIGAVIAQQRLATTETLAQREQAMVLRTRDLAPGQARAVFKTYSGFDMLRYNRLRMFVHMHGTLRGGRPLSEVKQMEGLEEARSKAKLFIRLGANENTAYYEYEQPLTPSALPTSADCGTPRRPALCPNQIDDLWQTRVEVGGEVRDLNSVNIALSALNQLKVARNNRGIPLDELFWNADADGVVAAGDLPELPGTPPGTRIGIKGNPSLSSINTLVIGLKNPDGNTEVLEEIEVWVNELRTTGYDTAIGQAGLFNADVKLADLGRFKANFTAQNDGWGDIQSTLGERDQVNTMRWSMATDFNAHKFIPERYGWQLPVSLQLQQSTATPRYSPQRGDVALQEVLAGIEENDELTLAEQEALKQEVREAAQTYSASRSFSTRVAKTRSRSRILRNTLDGVTASYAFSDNTGRTPTQRVNDRWTWNTALGYTFQTRQPRTFRPLGFMGGVPVLGVLGGLQFNYVPQRISLQGTAARNYGLTRDRPREIVGAPDVDAVPTPDLAQYPRREQHTFSHRRTFDFQYNPFGFLTTSYQSGTDQSLNDLGADTTRSLLVWDEAAGDFTTNPQGFTTFEEALDAGVVADSMLDVTAFELSQLDVVPTGRVFSRIRSGNGPRTDRYNQSLNLTFQPRTNGIEWLNWVQVTPFSYNTSFNWQNGAVGRATGAAVSNSIDLRGGLTVRPQEFWRKFGFYRSLEEAQRRAEQEREQARQEREQERARRREERRQRREEERRQREQAEQAEQDGATDPPEAEAEDAPDIRPEDMSPEERAVYERERQRQREQELEDDQRGADAVARARQAMEAGADEDDGEEAEADSSGGFRLPLPDPKALGRRTVLALTGMSDLTLTYNGNRQNRSSNVGVLSQPGALEAQSSYSLFDALFRGQGPPLAYRLGLDRRIDPNQRLIDGEFQVTDVLTNADRLSARTTLRPSRALTINVTWDGELGASESVQYRPLEDDDGFYTGYDELASENGNTSASVWAFGSSYRNLFEAQRRVLQADLDNASTEQLQEGVPDANGDGLVALSNESVVESFRQAYLSGLGPVDGRGLFPFPMPKWQITYSGIANWPILRRLVQTAALTHGYGADFAADYRSILEAADGRGGEVVLQAPNGFAGSTRLLYDLPGFETQTLRVNERWSPLIGVDLSFRGSLSGSVDWNKTNTYALSAGTNDVGELRTDEIAIRVGYQRRGLRLPFLSRRRLNNRLALNLNVSISETNDFQYRLKSALTDYLRRRDLTENGWVLDDALSGDNRSVLTETRRLAVTPDISYQFSNRVNASFRVTYEKFNGDSRQLSYTNVKGGFNVRVSISN